MPLQRPLSLLSALVVLASACGPESATLDVASDDDLSSGKTFEQFKAQTFRESDDGPFLVDGDIPLWGEDALFDFYVSYVKSGQLIVHQVNGVDSKWSDVEKLNLTYCVSKKSFGTRYEEVVQAMNAATAAWEAVANVNYTHLSQYDSDCTATQTNVVFDVNYSRSGEGARAFFPTSPRNQRNIIIYKGTFLDPVTYPLIGVLRHELGHTLGFRHEHIRPEAGPNRCNETSTYRELTAYDSASVMHYPWCPGATGDGSLSLTALDGQGAAALYGAP